MSSRIRVIKKSYPPEAVTVGTSDVWANVEVMFNHAEWKGNMAMIRCHVETAILSDDRHRAEFLFSQLVEQQKRLATKFGFGDQKLIAFPKG